MAAWDSKELLRKEVSVIPAFIALCEPAASELILCFVAPASAIERCSFGGKVMPRAGRLRCGLSSDTGVFEEVVGTTRAVPAESNGLRAAGLLVG